MLPLYKNQPIDFHCKSMSWCQFNGNTGLKLVKWNSWKSCWCFKVRPWGKPFQLPTQPKLNVLKTFIWHPGRHMNLLCMFNLLHCYLDSTFPQRSWVLGWYTFINFWKNFCHSLIKCLNSDWVRVMSCMLRNIVSVHYLW